MKVRFYDISILPVIFLGSLLVAYSYHKLELAAEDFKCLKCHKGSRSLPNIVKEKNIQNSRRVKVLYKKRPKVRSSCNRA